MKKIDVNGPVRPDNRGLQREDLLPTEEQEQIALANYLDICGLTWCHVPNGVGKLGRATAGIARAKGLKKGFPDILIFDLPQQCLLHKTKPSSEEPCLDLLKHGFVIELKRRKPLASPVSDEQKWWLERLADLGWIAHVAYGADDAIDWIKSWGLGR